MILWSLWFWLVVVWDKVTADFIYFKHWCPILQSSISFVFLSKNCKRGPGEITLWKMAAEVGLEDDEAWLYGGEYCL